MKNFFGALAIFILALGLSTLWAWVPFTTTKLSGGHIDLIILGVTDILFFLAGAALWVLWWEIIHQKD